MILIIISVLLYLDTAFEENIRKNIIRLPSDFKTTLQLPCMKRRLIHVKSAWDCSQRLPVPVSMRISMSRTGHVRNSVICPSEWYPYVGDKIWVPWSSTTQVNPTPYSHRRRLFSSNQRLPPPPPPRKSSMKNRSTIITKIGDVS